MQAQPATGPLARLVELLLTSDRVQRLRLIQCCLALSLMAVSVAIMNYGVWAGVVHSEWTLSWSMLSLGGLSLAYLLIRSGVSARFPDPSLTGLQAGFAIACAAAAYGIAGPLRGAVFPVLMSVLVFTMFQLRLRNTVLLSFFALLLFSIVMTVMVVRQPDVYLPAVEGGHFMMLLATLPVISLLAGRLSQIRLRLAQQKRELVEALGKIQLLATRDSLTGLVNRHHMQTLLDQEVQRSQRSGHSFCLCLLDIDHFKRINDEHGHAAGDEVLREFAALCLNTIRGTDVIARWGGEEFVLMLPDTRMPLALTGLERLRERVRMLKVSVAGSEIGVTVSAGLAQHKPDETLAQTLERADQLLYKAKHLGRNRVVID